MGGRGGVPCSEVPYLDVCDDVEYAKKARGRGRNQNGRQRLRSRRFHE